MPFRTPSLCQSLAGNSFHPNLIVAALGGEATLRAFINAEQREHYICEGCVRPPAAVQEHFGTTLLPYVREQTDGAKMLAEAWNVKVEQLSSLGPYRHLSAPTPDQLAAPAPSIRYGQAEDHSRNYSLAAHNERDETVRVNRQLSPGVCHPKVHDYLVKWQLNDLLLALRTTSFQVNRVFFPR